MTVVPCGKQRNIVWKLGQTGQMASMAGPGQCDLGQCYSPILPLTFSMIDWPNSSKRTPPALLSWLHDFSCIWESNDWKWVWNKRNVGEGVFQLQNQMAALKRGDGDQFVELLRARTYSAGYSSRARFSFHIVLDLILKVNSERRLRSTHYELCI